MPLKHLTETILVIVLAIVVCVTGMVLPSLPPLPQGVLPWAIVFLLTFAYPAALYPFLKRNRADYTFRLLHFLPTLLTLLWFLAELVALYIPPLAFLPRSFTFGWTLAASTPQEAMAAVSGDRSPVDLLA